MTSQTANSLGALALLHQGVVPLPRSFRQGGLPIEEGGQGGSRTLVYTRQANAPRLTSPCCPAGSFSGSFPRSLSWLIIVTQEG